jgi:Flp pilus assembly protein TadD
VLADDDKGMADPVAEAEALTARGLLPEAIATLQRAIGESPAAHLHVALATLYLRRGDGVQARRELERALAVDPGYGVAYAYLGGLAAHAGRVHEAEELLERARTLAPADVLVAIKRAEYWMLIGVYDNARDELRQAMRESGGSPGERELAQSMLAAIEQKRRGSFTRNTVAFPSIAAGIRARFVRKRRQAATTEPEVE